MIKAVPQSKPPGQYVVAKGTQYCLVPNEYDKNTYAQCGYVSNRTLIRCRQIRSKEELAKNGGKCEEHDMISDMLKDNFDKEILRLKSEADTMDGRRKKFSSLIYTNERIGNEDDYLLPISNQPEEIHNQVYQNYIDEDPLRYAEYFTEKDILRIVLKSVNEDINDLKHFRRLLHARASRIYERTNDNKATYLDFLQQRIYGASLKSGHVVKEKNPNSKIEPPARCEFDTDMLLDTEGVVKSIVNEIVCTVSGIEAPQRHCCKEGALPLTKYCSFHVLLDNKQKLFGSCTICQAPAISTNDPTCDYHLKELVKIRTLNPMYNVRKGEEDIRSANNDPSERTIGYVKEVKIEEDVFEQDNDSNYMTQTVSSSLLAKKYANMPSPLASIHQTNSLRRNVPPVPSIYQKRSSESASSKQMLPNKYLLEGNKTDAASKNELLTMVCARERPFTRDYFNIQDNEKKMLKQPLLGPSRSMISLPNSRFGHLMPGSRQSPIQQKYAQYAAAPEMMRIRKPNDMKEDSSQKTGMQNMMDSPVQYPRPMNEQRGIPYVRRTLPFAKPIIGHRTQIVSQTLIPSTPQASQSQSQQQPPPPAPHVRPHKSSIPINRQISSLPPHRAMKMGINTSVPMKTPRPSFTQRPTPQPAPLVTNESRRCDMGQSVEQPQSQPQEPSTSSMMPNEPAQRMPMPDELLILNLDVKTYLQYKAHNFSDDDIAKKIKEKDGKGLKKSPTKGYTPRRSSFEMKKKKEETLKESSVESAREGSIPNDVKSSDDVKQNKEVTEDVNQSNKRISEIPTKETTMEEPPVKKAGLIEKTQPAAEASEERVKAIVGEVIAETMKKQAMEPPKRKMPTRSPRKKKNEEPKSGSSGGGLHVLAELSEIARNNEEKPKERKRKKLPKEDPSDSGEEEL